jgi:phenol 2-monooxygenase
LKRQAKAQELIDFDRDMARLFSEKPKTKDEAAQFQAYFKKHGRYTAGVETCYAPSLITGSDTHQALAKGFPVGKRFHSAAPKVLSCLYAPTNMSPWSPRSQP